MGGIERYIPFLDIKYNENKIIVNAWKVYKVCLYSANSYNIKNINIAEMLTVCYNDSDKKEDYVIIWEDILYEQWIRLYKYNKKKSITDFLI